VHELDSGGRDALHLAELLAAHTSPDRNSQGDLSE
jgi:hypothetical protein